MDVVHAIRQGDVIRSVTIVRAGKKAGAFQPDEDTFRSLVAAVEARVKQEEEQNRREEERKIQSRWPGADVTEGGLRYLILQTGSGPRPSPGSRLELIYSGQTMEGTPFASSEDGTPQSGSQAVAFVHTPDETRLIPALLDSVQDLREGEKRLLIVPAALAYGNQGFYAPEKEGEPRFVISPNTTLVIEVTLRKIL
jgi:peptidylprolyl isomerase